MPHSARPKSGPMAATNKCLARSNKGQGADLLETRGRDDLSDRAIEVS
jgi:hypothetical protein